MKRFAILALFLGSLTPALHAQSYSITWHKVAGGGGTSVGGAYSLSGTIGQPDASKAMTGGSYALTGGFWSIISIVQTPNSPPLAIARSNSTVIVSWPASATGFVLEQNANLAAKNNWTTNTATVTTQNGTNSITISPPTGSLFFRLINP